jgi:UDP-glucose 4-epimerase
MKIIVTGGSGFIGSHLVDALILDGHDVTVVDALEPRKENKNAKAEYVRINILDERLKSVFTRVRPDIVYHLAAHIDDRASVGVPFFNARENILGSLNVFESVRLMGGVKKILFTSTSVVYGSAKERAFTEKVIPEPLTPYGISKLSCEYYLHFYLTTYGIPYVALRLANVYGPRQDGSKECGATAIFTGKLLLGEQPFMNNDGETVRDYIFVKDVVDLLMRGMESNVAGVFNCGTGVGTTTNTLYDMIAKEVGSDIRPVFRPDVQDQVKRSIMKSAVARKTFTWRPKTSLEKGISETVAWYKERL